MIDATDIKVCISSIIGLGNWLVDIDLILKVAISLASLVYIILKIRELIANKRR
jgi:biotin synthase-like enzyme